MYFLPRSKEMVGLSFEEAKHLGLGRSLLDDKSLLGKIQVRDASQYQRLGYFKEICEKAVKAMPDVAFAVFTTSPWSTAMMLRGMETMIYDTTDDADFVHELLRFTTEFAKTVGDALLETDVDIITIADPSAGCSVISPGMFRKWAKPYLEETIHHLKRQEKIPILLHICGYTDPIMEDLVSLGIDGLSIDAPSSLQKLVEISQKKIVIQGNFPGELYVEGTTTEIEEKVKESVEIAAEPSGYRYVLCSGCQVPENASLENVRYFLESGHRHGRRPLTS